ncbi:MAG: substrate-binding domain-containing protein [Labrys sp. (in: a-proteobacteria)]
MRGSSTRLTLEDVAREAGVSLATVDRVVNARPGVRDDTVERVQAAMAQLGYRPNLLAARLARRQVFRFAFLLPTNDNAFMRALDDQIDAAADWLEAEYGSIERIAVDVFDPLVLAETLHGLAGRFDGVAVVALDDDRVRAAIDRLAETGMRVVTLVSDVPSSKRLHYVGIDNVAAGRTAGTLMGRFLPDRSGTIGVIVGSPALSDHAQRHQGFVDVIAAEHPRLAVLPPRAGRDDPGLCREATLALLAEHPDLVGLYNVGAGNEGVAEALALTPRRLIVIGHELTAATRPMLMRGDIAALIAQDPGHEIRSAARILLATAMHQPFLADQERIRIEIFVRDNAP